MVEIEDRSEFCISKNKIISEMTNNSQQKQEEEQSHNEGGLH